MTDAFDPIAPDALLLRAVEAMLFAADAPLSADEMARHWNEVTGDDLAPSALDAAVGRLNDRLAESASAVRVHAWAEGYRLASVEAVAPFVAAVARADAPARLSRAVLETLAVVAYKQPVTKPEVDHVRGVSSDHTLRTLMERGFVSVVGRADSVGRPLLYGTTPAFLDAFGLASLDALPLPREIDEILADPAFTREKIRLLADAAPAALPTAPDAPTA